MQGAVVDMDINVLRGAILLVLIFSFIGLWKWAWSKKRKDAFHQASLLPLEEDSGQTLNTKDPANGKGSEPS